MYQTKKSLRASYPFRIVKKASIYLTKQIYIHEIDKYQSLTELDGGFQFIITSDQQISTMDGKIFDYILSQMHLHQNKFDNLNISIDLDDLLEKLKYKHRTENRRKMIEHIKNMVGVEIMLKWNVNDEEQEASFGMLESVKLDANDIHSCEIVLCSSYVEAMDKEVAGQKYIDILKLMSIRSGISFELGKVLQLYGKIIKGESFSIPSRISHITLCQYLHLDPKSTSTISQLRKSFNQLEVVGYPKYKYMNKAGLWSLKNT